MTRKRLSVPLSSFTLLIACGSLDQLGFADQLVPPGYVKIEVNDGVNEDWNPRINNARQVVFARFRDVPNQDPWEGDIMLWDDGVITNLTNTPNYSENQPDINVHGDVIWDRTISSLDFQRNEIMLLENGIVRQLTQSDGTYGSTSPRINDAGHAVWTRRCDTPFCVEDEPRALVAFWNGVTEQIITPRRFRVDFQLPTINNADEVIWTTYTLNLSEPPIIPETFRSDVHRWRDGETTRLSDPIFENAHASNGNANDQGIAVWNYSRDVNAQMREDGVRIFADGKYDEVTRDGIQAVINNHRQVTFGRYNNADGNYNLMIAAHGGIRLLVDEPNNWILPYDFNDHGDIAVERLVHLPDGRIRLEIFVLLRMPYGDLNCSDALTVADIPAFVTALTNAAEYATLYPECDITLADVNRDGVISVSDIPAFVNALVE